MQLFHGRARGVLVGSAEWIVDIIVSNRVASASSNGPIMGGLAAALLPAVERSGAVWFGSSGKTRKIAPGVSPLVQVEAYGRGSLATVDLPDRDYRGFYDGFANSTLWPLLHSRADLAQFSALDYASYCQINAYMAKSLATFGGDDSTFWVHDYHFLPLGRELRKLGITRRIGFFLHTPWPKRRIIAQLPQYRELAEAMLAYDLIGFQTDVDCENFLDLLRQDLQIACVGGQCRSRYGVTRLASFPIGIDTEEFSERARQADGDPVVQRLRASLAGGLLAIGVDRVDYSKGLAERVRAFDRLLETNPRFKRRVNLLQIALPSRSSIEAYRTHRCELAAAIGEVNGKHGEVDWTPIRYLNQGFCQATLAGLYRTAAVGLVTPLRDGMNLVAKEYIAAQDPADPGVLVLSKFAGAARELDSALLVDPADIEGIARNIAIALQMPRQERRARWQPMMDSLMQRSIHTWFADFMAQLKAPQHNVVLLPPTKVPALASIAGELAVGAQAQL
jgi:trehalose 6-phosphate synthase